MDNPNLGKLNIFYRVTIVIAGLIWFVFLYSTPDTMNILALKYAHPLSTSYMRDKGFKHPFLRPNYKWVKYSDISNYLKDAVVAAEDDHFYKHFGIDLEAIKKAAKINWKRKRLAFGGSTISQQLVRNLYLTPSKDPFRKAREALLALFLEFYLSKERILELYLNVVEWGPNIYGAEAASKYYFKGHAKNLNASQAAFLASILPNPVKKGKGGYRMTAHALSIYNMIK